MHKRKILVLIALIVLIASAGAVAKTTNRTYTKSYADGRLEYCSETCTDGDCSVYCINI